MFVLQVFVALLLHYIPRHPNVLHKFNDSSSIQADLNKIGHSKYKKVNKNIQFPILFTYFI